MYPFAYQNEQLFAEDVAVADIAKDVGTPCYIYSRAMIEDRWRNYHVAFAGRDHQLCFAVKANSNLAVLDVLARLGSGFDIVSIGELERVLRAGGAPEKIVFSGVGKTATEIARALEAGIGCFNVESEAELTLLDRVAAEYGRQAPIAMRVNPDVDPNTHPYIATGLKENKFGIPIDSAERVYATAQSLTNLKIIGIACHIGSQLTEIRPFIDALERILETVDYLADNGISLEQLNLGGGLGIHYVDEAPPEPDEYVMALMAKLQTLGSRYQALRILIEPGRSIVGNAGILVTKVLYTKSTANRNFAVVDAAMNDLLRPALYGAWQDIIPVQQADERPTAFYDVVGPVCETGDFLGRDRELAIDADALLAIMSAGAYGSVMSSNYNSRPRCAEVMVDGRQYHIVRQRETIDDMLAPECLLPD